MRISAANQVTTWVGKIFAARRRQKARAVSPGRADQVMTNPLSTKKKLSADRPTIMATVAFVPVQSPLKDRET